MIIKTAKLIIIKIIRLYQLIMSPFLGKNCRFLPTCSQYSIETIKKNGIFYGILFCIIRILKCNPLFKGGVDEVKSFSTKTKKIINFSLIILLLSCVLAYAETKPKKQLQTSKNTPYNTEKKQRKLKIIKKIENIRKKYILEQNLNIKNELYQKIQSINVKRKPYNKFARKKIPHSLVVDHRAKKNRHISFLLKKKHLLSNIFNTIYENDSQAFLAFLKKLDEPNAINVATGETLLTEAIKLKRRRIIYHLISHGANLNKTNLKKETPLYIAIKTKNAPVVKSLLKFGAKKDMVDSNGETYLMKAININYIPTIKAILDAGVSNIDQMNKNKVTAIDLAYIGKKQIVVKLLEKYGFFLHKSSYTQKF